MREKKLASQRGAMLISTLVLAAGSIIMGFFILYGIVAVNNANEVNEIKSDLNMVHWLIIEGLGSSGCSRSLADAKIDTTTITIPGGVIADTDPCASRVPPMQSEFQANVSFQLKNGDGRLLLDYSMDPAIGRFGAFDIKATCTYRRNTHPTNTDTYTPCIAAYYARRRELTGNTFINIPGKGANVWSWHSIYHQPVCCGS